MSDSNIEYDLILKLTTSFYDFAKKDVMIGYHFRFIEDFDSHIPRIADFWNLQINGKINDKSHLPFKLLEVHKELGIKKGELGRWKKIFIDNLNTYTANQELSSQQNKLILSKMEHFFTKIEHYLFK